MVFHPFEVTIPHIIYACLGGFIVLFGMFSLLLREKLYIGEACWAFLFGVIIGPYCANVFDPRSWGGADNDITNTITLEFTRVVLAIGVFAIGVELPKAYMARHWKSLFFLLVPVMTWGWFVSAGLIYALIPGLNFLSSLAVAACLTPTDPILAAAVVGGKWADKHVPAHLRHLLAAESGCNDGAAYPFLFISLYLILDAPDTGHAIRDWILLLWLYQVILGIVIGCFLGFGFRHLMKFCQRHDLIDRHSYVAQYLSLAMLTIGVTTLLGSDDLLAAFFCGTAFAWDGFFNRQTEESVFSSVIDLLFNIGAFVFVGAWMPFNKFQDATLTLSVWRLIVIAILVLLLRRLPVMIALYRWIPDVKTFREAVFSGHFGPIGIGAVYISTLAAEVIHDAHKSEDNPQTKLLAESIQPIVAFMVLCSIITHGLSIPGFSLGRRVHSVSRTWSRHTTLPDWTNQARHVSRGEDIVINRDDAMERGDAPMDEKTDLSLQKHESGSSTTLERQPGYEGSIETKIDPSAFGPDYREEAPPDGTETMSEWQEPHHKIIERREGPGSDVDVEVTNDEDPESPSSGIRLVRRHGPEQLKHEEENMKKTVLELKQNARDYEEAFGEKLHNILSPTKAHPSEIAVVQDGEDEEGWASEGSAGNEPSTSSITRSNSSRKKSRALGGRHGRQRTSLRRPYTAPAHISSFPQSRPSVSATGPESDEMSRGRDFRYAYANAGEGSSSSKRPFPSRPGTTGGIDIRPRQSHPGTADSSLRHRQLESLRALHRPPTREASPSRSVRFVDDDKALRSVPVTPPEWPSRNGSGSSGEDGESGRGRPTFIVSGEGTDGGGDGIVEVRRD